MGRIDENTGQAVRRFLALIASHFDIAGAIVYGSRARGTYRPDSDADVAVLLKGEHQRVLPTTLAMADVAYEVLLETGINITPLPVWLDEWEHPENHSNPSLLHNIAREGVSGLVAGEFIGTNADSKTLSAKKLLVGAARFMCCRNPTSAHA